MLNKIDGEIKFIDNLYLKMLKKKQDLTLSYILCQKIIKKDNIYFNLKFIEEKLINTNYKISIDIIYNNYWLNNIEIFSSKNKYKVLFKYLKIKNEYKNENTIKILNKIQYILK